MLKLIFFNNKPERCQIGHLINIKEIISIYINKVCIPELKETFYNNLKI